MKNKLIINIGRQIGSGGYDIAKLLAKVFDCQFYDKELLNLAAKKSGFSEKFFEQNDEQRSFLKSHLPFHLPFIGNNAFYKNRLSPESLYLFQSDVIREAADSNMRCVFLGRTADYILRDHKECINIFITANIEDRIQNICQRKGCNEDEAHRIIENGENERRKYYNYYTGKVWGAAESYDLIINISCLGLEETTNLITEFIRKKYTK